MEHQQKMIQQPLDAQAQTQAQVLANQQAQQENELKEQQDMQAAPSLSPSKGKKRYYSAKKKLSVVMEHKKGACSAYATAKRHAVSKRPSKLTENDGPEVADPALEAAVLEYCGTLRDSDIAVSTNMLIVKALSIDPTFCGGMRKRLFTWLYKLMERHTLCMRRPTRQGQKKSNHLTQVMNDFVGNLSGRFLPFGTLEDVPMDRVVNMDETPEYFERKVHTTISQKGATTVSARVCSTHNRVSVCLAVTATGTKLPPYVVFKGVPGARIDASLEKILPANVFACCQINAWPDDPTTEEWMKKVWQPFAGEGGPSLLLLDDYKCHKQPKFTREVANLGSEL
ncbi:hypothetical protein DYB28_001804 [Aphanomyces astaci]|uniref:DDE-1 domain-containing protein n=1 Tax=Aphanomyces astaci TaxID=112090 RepID=A0A9X8E4W9_APHAT|nr:hypothetical protein DYB28_001804 [Aphanomyces astaci]